MRNNIILNTDSYKQTHHLMEVPGTETVYSYFESRNGAKYNKTVFFGLQYLIREYLAGNVVTTGMIEEADRMCRGHFGMELFNRKMWEHIVDVHNGKLPLRIRAVKEGSCVDVSNVLLTVENTDPLCAPLTNHCETLLSNLWGPCTTASLSREVKILCAHYLNETGGSSGAVSFMLHDFGQRGVAAPEVAALNGAGHLINFMGTDTMLAMQLVDQYYNATMPVAYSVPASEHSIMTALGPEGEFKVFERLLDTYPKGILSLVIDSYDYRRFVSEYALKLKDKILARDGKVVFRPDSGDPDAVTLDVLQGLKTVFGATKNAKGYWSLNPKVGALWGDGIDYDGIRGILFTMRNTGWAADNIVFGMGGGLLQKQNRDTQRFAFKSSAQQRDGVWYDVFKKPIDSSKASKRGRLKLIKSPTGYCTVGENDYPELTDCLETVFENGIMKRTQTFDEIRANCASEK